MTGMAAFLAVCIWKRKDGHKWRKALSASFLSIYYYLLYLYTIVFRPQYSKPQYELALFWRKEAVDAQGQSVGLHLQSQF